MQDQPVMRVEPEFLRRELHKLALDGFGVLADGKPRAVRDAKDMRVDGDRRLAERDVHHDVRGLAAYARKLLERLAIARHLAAVFVEKLSRQRDDVLRLHVEKADRADVRN